MTHKEALQLSLELWTWLAANPSKGKENWPRYNEIRQMVNHCPLCECHRRCIDCPLFRGGSCADGAYKEWEEEKNTDAAQDIVTMIKEAME